ncbi:MAG: hypothetical protein KY453_05800, partial [Gemmatimonadetes bacterium]|nr:hypothetical protein [Gemmatimonadota bacterium]
MTPARRLPRIAGTFLVAVAGLAIGAAAQEMPSTPPSPQDVLGWDLGEQFTDVASLGMYFHTLERTTPLVSVHPYGRTWEGRPLLQVLVASEAHRERLEEILALNRELTDPATSEARAREIIASGQPAVIYFSYGVHGNESSSSEAAMWTTWDLVREAPEVASVLDSAVVVIDPALNPDGRERYLSFYNGARGTEPNPAPEAREHREPWPGGRFNHYLFDLNRDWAWLSQIETRARAATWDRWLPQVHVDFHEMSYQSSYFFFPAAEPINPLYPETTLKWGRIFGEANAAAFDREGWLYYTGESYDQFYPGYGDSWPGLLGSIGMTYEQAGGGFAGLAVERPDGTVLTLRERAQHHRTSGQATARAAAMRRTELLGDFAAFHRNVDAGQPDFLLVAEGDADRSRALVDLLLEQGIEVERAGRAFRADARAHGIHSITTQRLDPRIADTAVDRPRRRLDARFLVAFALVLAPWTIRNAIVLDRFVPVSTGGGKALFIGTYMPGDGDHFRTKRQLYYAQNPDSELPPERVDR